MIATAHLAVGAASAIAVQSVLASNAGTIEKTTIAFAAGFLSHLILDAIPHQEYTLRGYQLWIILSVEVLTVFLILLSPSNLPVVNLMILAGMAGGALPDFMDLVHDYFLQWPLLADLSRIVHLSHFKSAPLRMELSYYAQILIAVFAAIFTKYKSV